VRQIGRIGQDIGALYNPYALAVDDLGHVRIVDEDGRLQTFDQNGKLMSSISIPFSLEQFAALSDERLFVNTPWKGKLITVYSPSGSPL
jgi:hypothetical protein